MKLLWKIALAVVVVNALMFIVLVTSTPDVTPPSDVFSGAAHLVDKTTYPDGSCSLFFEEDGIEFAIEEEAEENCSEISPGDIINY